MVDAAPPTQAPFDPKRLQRSWRRGLDEQVIRAVLFLAAAIGVLTTAGILFSLASETVAFFQQVSFAQFFGDTRWTPLFSSQRFGIWALISATLLTSFIALLIAIPLGLVSAIYLSEFAAPRTRDTIKPLLEILAGVPTVVYGFFALTFLTPLLQPFVPGLQTFNSLSAGFIMGIMIVPLVSSLSEDALSSVPRSLREGAFALGATRFEVATQVVVPAALSGIVASVILALSRAVGETMVVAVAAGQTPNFTVDPRVAVETMTAYIVQVSLWRWRR
ncbi:MAG: phosphate transporter, inner rane subunit PstC [Thermomicrobiales bacterium]|nr:phosphate transporter, inner rane subunit PstC [Thermomicrobiales bacterium]